MSRVELAKIPALTFYKDSETAARRTSAIPQLVCRGKPCTVYQPEVVRCVNLGGGVGTDVDWKCEADLPESLRFGKVEVSCEGWSRPGDPHVLKGSCSLDYRLVQVPGSLLQTDSPRFGRSYDLSSIIFMVLWVGFLVFILYNLLQSCFRRNTTRTAPDPTSGPSPRPGGGSGWFPGSHDDDPTGPPPPYESHPKNPTNAPNNTGWNPGFWTGAALGGVMNHLWNSRQQARPREPIWDWERERVTPRPTFMSGRRTSAFRSDDRGEGSSNLGAMRRSTGLGGSNVR